MHLTKASLCLVALTLLSLSPAQAQVDLTGMWGQLMHSDAPDRGTGPDYGDYTGLPLSAAGLLRAETWSDQKWTVPEHQCEPHPIDYAPWGPAGMRIWSDVDHPTQQMTALHQTFQWMITHRVIWLDGRPHPSQYAPHTWMGFSTGKWIGDMLVVNTTHIKEGWTRRNGPARSEKGKLTEYWMRHDNLLTITSITEDPVYLTEPVVRSMNWQLDPGYQHGPYPCSARVEIERPQGFVAHFLPGENPLIAEFRQKLGVPVPAAQGGAESLYPEYEQKLRDMIKAAKK